MRDRQTLPPSSPAAVRTAPSAPAPAGRFEELEAYRGIAAVLIVVFHAYQYSREGTAASAYVYEGTPLHHVFQNLEATVAWFFALSGFLLFLPFARDAIDRRRPQAARGFLIRRAIRIVPPYYLAILLVWTWRYTGRRDERLDLAEHLSFTQVFDRTHIFWTIGPAWSLAVEVQFYVVLAFLGLLLHRACGRVPTRRARAWFLGAVVGGIGLAGLGYTWWATTVAHLPREDFPAYFGLQAKLDNFAAGMLIAVAVAAAGGKPVVGRLGGWLLRIAGLTLLTLTFALRPVGSAPHAGSWVDRYFHTLSAAAFALVLASTVLGPRGTLWARVLAKPPLQLLGVVSYSLYLWHEPILTELGRRRWLINPTPHAFPVNALVLVVLSLAAGGISYRILERPTAELRHLFTRAGRLAPRYPEDPRK